MRTAVLIHGLHVDSKDWEHLVWGDPRAGQLGRAARGIVEAANSYARLIFWGTGASQKDGLKESEYTKRLALSRLDELMSHIHTFTDVEVLRQYVESVSFTDTVTQNTAQEAKAALVRCREIDIEQMTMVSTPSHLPRCFRDARKAAKELGMTIKLYATDADTFYPDEEMNDVVILEVPHRPDRAAPSFAAIAKRLFAFYGNPELADELARAWSELMDRFEEKLKKLRRAA